jgi:hypothetical protein
MQPQCRRALASVAATPWPSRRCGYRRCYGGQWASRTRDISETSASGTNTGHPQPCTRTRSQSRTTEYPTDLPLKTYVTLTSVRRDMNPPRNSDTLPSYDWRTFAPGTQLHYIRSEEVANHQIARIASHPGPFTIGLDFEWRPTFVARRPENPVALVQVACDDKILLVQVSAMQSKLFFHTSSLWHLAPDSSHNQLFPRISVTFWSRRRAQKSELAYNVSGAKIGFLSSFVDVGGEYDDLDDCKKLWRDHRVSVRNCVDLALFARSVDPQWKGPYKGGIGLSRLAETYLQRKLPKGGIQRSNWDLELSTLQQECEWHPSSPSFLPREKSVVGPTTDVRFVSSFFRRGQ